MSRKWLGPVLILAAILATLPLYGRLPEQVPTHWNFRGEADSWGPRFPAAFLAPLIAAGLWVLLPVLRRIDPRKRNYERFDETFWVLLNVLTLGMLGIHAMTLAMALGAPVEPGRMVLFVVGALFAALGNYLPRLRSNWWMGIRTPWTLDNEEVWRRTHRLGGRTFVIGGFVCMLAAFLPQPFGNWIGMIGLTLAAFTPVIYSWFAYRRAREEAPQP